VRKKRFQGKTVKLKDNFSVVRKSIAKNASFSGFAGRKTKKNFAFFFTKKVFLPFFELTYEYLPFILSIVPK